MSNNRGKLTEEVKELAKHALDLSDFSVSELRLLPYIQYTMMNSQRIDPNHINKEDREILSRWRANGWITGGASQMTITKEFWDAMNEILWCSYVDCD